MDNLINNQHLIPTYAEPYCRVTADDKIIIDLRKQSIISQVGRGFNGWRVKAVYKLRYQFALFQAHQGKFVYAIVEENRSLSTLYELGRSEVHLRFL